MNPENLFQWQRENSLRCDYLIDASTDASVQPSRSRLIRQRSGGVYLPNQQTDFVQPHHVKKKKMNNYAAGYIGDAISPTNKDVLFGRGKGYVLQLDLI